MKTLKPIVFGVFALILLFVIVPVPKSQAMNLQRQGFDVNPNDPNDFGSDSFKKSMTNLALTGANSVSLIVPYRQYNSFNPSMGNASNTPTDSSLTAGIQYIHSLGMKVTLRFHIDANDQSWRANINTPDRDGWFNNYGSMLTHYAYIAQQNGVEDLCLGQELIAMTSTISNPSNTSHWQNMIASLRNIYKGRMYYGANSNPQYQSWYDEKDNIGFWSSLDFIGMSAYPTLTYNTYASIGELESGWSKFDNNEVLPAYNKFGLPITFTEVGFRSMNTAYINPWDYSRNDPYDGTAQSNAYQAFFNYYNNKSHLNGVFIWHWSTDPNAGGAGNTDYYVQNKPAQQTIKAGFNGVVNPVSNGIPTFTSDSSNNGGNVNTDIPITINVHNTSQNSLINGQIDVEIYNSANVRIQQSVTSNQTINANQSIVLNTILNTSTQDNYVIKLGVFSSDWQKNYFWSPGTGNVNVGNNNPTPTPTPTPTPSPTPIPPTNASLSIWWPGDMSGVSGVQPFKARIDNMNLNDYNLYWQVDGGELNKMNDVQDNAPHKQYDVDLSSWKWRSDRNYTINFVAKDLNGNILKQKSVVIHVYN